MFVDGKGGPPHGHVSGLAVSPDGARYGYLVNEGGKAQKYGHVDGGRWSVVIDGQAQPGDFHSAFSLIFGPRGHAAYAVSDGDQGPARVIADGKPHRDFRSVAYTLRFAPDGRVVYSASLPNGQSCGVLEGRRSPRMGGVGR